MNVLVLDDNPGILNSLSSVAILFGQGVDQAGNGLEAIRLLEQGRYDAVVTDANMPCLDGTELCRILKA